jgi:hypothetical protein
VDPKDRVEYLKSRVDAQHKTTHDLSAALQARQAEVNLCHDSAHSLGGCLTIDIDGSRFPLPPELFHEAAAFAARIAAFFEERADVVSPKPPEPPESCPEREALETFLREISALEEKWANGTIPLGEASDSSARNAVTFLGKCFIEGIHTALLNDFVSRLGK